MMRDIKFRGKRVDNGEWVYGFFIADILEQVGRNDIPLGFIRHYDQSKGQTVMHEVARKTIGQYTGLKDKNGTDIYEGDNVKILELTNDELFEYKSNIWWEEGSFLVKSRFENCDLFLAQYYGDPNASYPTFEIEVIGNIHDKEVKI